MSRYKKDSRGINKDQLQMVRCNVALCDQINTITPFQIEQLVLYDIVHCTCI